VAGPSSRDRGHYFKAGVVVFDAASPFLSGDVVLQVGEPVRSEGGKPLTYTLIPIPLLPPQPLVGGIGGPKWYAETGRPARFALKERGRYRVNGLSLKTQLERNFAPETDINFYKSHKYY
jgi:hypothetical protein